MRYFFKFIKNLLFFTIKTIYGTIISLIFLLFIGIIVIMGLIELTKEEKVVIKDGTYIELTFPRGINEKKVFDFKYFEQISNLAFFQVIDALELARKDSKIEGVVLKLDNINLNSSQIEELSNKLNQLKNSSKKIYSYATNLNKRNYILGVVADEIYMNPSHSTFVSFGGYEIKVPYYKNITEKFGIEFQVVHIGDYKSFGENYVKERMSDEFRENYQRLGDNSLEYFINNVSFKREIGYELVKEKVLGGNYLMLDSKGAKVEGLIDEIAFYDDFLEEKGIEETISLEKYYKNIDKVKKGEKIALIVASGGITMNSSEGFKSDYISPYEIINQIEKAMEDDSIKGVVLRIDSPGGSALASEIIVEKLNKLKEVKPFYVSMSSVAASGGYYISSNANKIFANKNTITGSIGVVMMSFNLEEFYKKIGLNWESISRGKTLDIFDLTEESSLEEIELLRNSANRTYDEFKRRVARGRGMKVEEIENIAQGKVYTGEEAKEIGLVDEIGTLESAIEDLAKELNLIDYQVVNLESSMNEIDYLMNFNFIKSKYKVIDEFEGIERNMEFYNELNNKFNFMMPYEVIVD